MLTLQLLQAAERLARQPNPYRQGTIKARRPLRYLTGYIPAMSSPDGVRDRISHRLGRP